MTDRIRHPCRQSTYRTAHRSQATGTSLCRIEPTATPRSQRSFRHAQDQPRQQAVEIPVGRKPMRRSVQGLHRSPGHDPATIRTGGPARQVDIAGGWIPDAARSAAGRLPDIDRGETVRCRSWTFSELSVAGAVRRVMIRLLPVRIVTPALDQPADQDRQASSPIDRQAVPRHLAGCRLGSHHAPPSTRPISVEPHGQSVVMD